MSITMTKADGVTVMTLTSDPKSAWPPLCQILKALCYSPVCCTVSQHLRKIQKTSQSVLGALQIMVGLLNIGLGAILLISRGGPWWIMDSVFPFWLGGLFILFGIMCILSEKCPSLCLVIINVILNLAGVAFAITAIVLYCLNMANVEWNLWEMCRRDSYYNWYDSRTTTASPSEGFMKDRCLEGKALILMLLRSINAVLIVLSALELCLVISSVVLGIKAVRSRQKGENKSTGDPEYYKPLLEVTTNPAA